MMFVAFWYVFMGLLQSSVNSAEVVGWVLHTAGVFCVALQILGSSGQDPIFVKIWIFGSFSMFKNSP
jgi:hypothetical protein